jgi:hypothetical protein
MRELRKPYRPPKVASDAVKNGERPVKNGERIYPTCTSGQTIIACEGPSIRREPNRLGPTG